MQRRPALRRQPDPWMRRALWLAPVLLGFVLYAGTLQFVAFHDDVHNIEILRAQTLRTAFSIRDYGGWDYRPLIAALWLLPRDLFGEFTPAVLHWYSVAVHALATALVVALAGRAARGGWGATLAGLGAGLWFATTPFAHQAVFWAGAIGHPLMTVCGLAGIHAMGRGLERRSAGWIGLAAALVVLAGFSHESGFVYGALIPLVAGGLLWLRGGRPTRWAWAAGGVVAAVGAGYALFYRLFITNSVWQGSSTEWGALGSSLGGVLTSMAFSLQAAIFPAVVAARYPILDVIASPAAVVAAVFVLAAVVLGPAFMLLRRAGMARLAGLLALWWLIALAPAAVFLGADYFTNAPRVQYALAPAVALWWGAVLAACARVGRPRLAFGGMLAVLLIGAAWGGRYVLERNFETLGYSDGVRAIAARLKASRLQDKVLFINYPVLSTPRQPGPAFLLGNEALSYAEITRGPVMRHVTALNGVDRASVEVRHELSLKANPRYIYYVSGRLVDDPPLRDAVLGANQIFRWEYGGQRLRARWLGSLEPAGGTPAIAEFRSADARVVLRGARAGACGDAPWLELIWETPQPPRQPATVFVHAFDADGKQVFGADLDPLGGLLPLHLIPGGAALTEMRELPPAGGRVAELRFGVYARDSGKRWQAIRPDGSPWEGDQVIARLSATCSPFIQRTR